MMTDRHGTKDRMKAAEKTHTIHRAQGKQSPVPPVRSGILNLLKREVRTGMRGETGIVNSSVESCLDMMRDRHNTMIESLRKKQNVIASRIPVPDRNKISLFWLGFITVLAILFILGPSGNVFADIQQGLPTSNILTQWDTVSGSPSHWNAVDDPVGSPDGNSSYIETSTNNDYDVFGYTAFSVPAGATINSVSVIFVARDGNFTGNNRMESVIRVNGTDYNSTGNYNPSGTFFYDTFTANWATNPATLLPWTVDDVNGIGTNPIEGFGVVSEDASPSLRVTQVYIEVDYTPAAACTRNAPTFSMGVNQSIAPAGSAVYTLDITNNDTAACADSTFNLSILSETGDTGKFTLPSVLSSASVVIPAGANDTSVILTVTGNGTGVNPENLVSTVEVRDDTDHLGQQQTDAVTTTIAPVCNRVDPTVTIQAPLALDIISGGGTADYTVSITNNDNGGGCGNSTFTLAANDVETIGSGSFVLPSTFVSGNSVTLAEGANTTKTLRVTAVGGPTSGDELQTTVTASDAPNHGDVTTGETAVTTINVPIPVGPNSPGTIISDATCGGLTPWLNTNNAGAQDDLYAQADNLRLEASACLKLTNFGFAIPGGSTIQGIVVESDRYGQNFRGDINDSIVQIVKGGAVTGVNKASASLWPNFDTNTYQSYGGNTDLWGEVWTPADINDPNFGVVIAAQEITDSANTDAFIDHVRITVYYTPGVVCTRNAPTFTMGVNQNIAPAGSAVYTLDITNNDTAACPDTTFDLSILSETGDTGNFTLPSVLSSATVTIAAGASDERI
jgi:hypothetical protein